jgi:hypothetical protein
MYVPQREVALLRDFQEQSLVNEFCIWVENMCWKGRKEQTQNSVESIKK